LARWILRSSGERQVLRNPDNFDLWIKIGQIVFVGLLIYYCWFYIAGVLMLCGAYYLWQEWEKNKRR
jgi:hypothetical protein